MPGERLFSPGMESVRSLWTIPDGSDMLIPRPRQCQIAAARYRLPGAGRALAQPGCLQDPNSPVRARVEPQAAFAARLPADQRTEAHTVEVGAAGVRVVAIEALQGILSGAQSSFAKGR